MTTQIRDLIKDYLNKIPWQTRLQPTLPAQDVSKVLHEPAILSGYRVPYQTWTYYFLSVFQLHNETVNIWTHLIGTLIIVHQLYDYLTEYDVTKDKVARTYLAFGVTCIVGLLTSAIVHLLHAKSPHVHFVAFMYDYVGTTVSCFGTGLLSFYGLSHESFYRRYEHSYIPFLAVLVVANFINLSAAKMLYGHDPHNNRRKLMMLGGMLIMSFATSACFIPRYVICLQESTCSVFSLNHLTTLYVVFVLEGLSFAAHQPEKTWPGKFDIFGHGHQVFHILVVLNQILQLKSVQQDNHAGLNHHGDPDLTTLLVTMALIWCLCAFIVESLKKYVPAAIDRVNEAKED